MSGSTTPTTPAPYEQGSSSSTTTPVAARHRGRRPLVVLAATLVALLGVFYLGGGWYFSGQIESGALTSTPGPMVPSYNLTVTAVGPGRYLPVLGDLHRPSSRRRATRCCGTAVGPRRSADGDGDGTVTRPLTDVTGAPLAAGAPAALETGLVHRRPADGARLCVRGRRGHGRPRPAPGLVRAGRDRVHLDGGAGPRTRGVPARDPAGGRDRARAGYNVLAITYLGDYGNMPYADGHLGFGATEWPDVEAAVEWALARGTTDVVLVGNSMGTTVVAAFLRESDSAALVRGVVLDSAAIDLAQTVEAGAAEVSLPVLGAPPSSLVTVAEWFAHLRFGVDWDYLDYADDEMWDSVPTLALHGAEDPTVTVQVSRDFAALHPTTVQFEEFAGAQHVESWNTDRSRYEAVMTAFLGRVRAS